MNRKVLAIVLIIIIGGSAGAIGFYFFLVPKPNPYDFAIVFATGSIGDRSFNEMAYDGAVQARDELGINFIYYEPEDSVEFEPAQRHFAAHPEWIEPYKAIITIGYDQADALNATARDYPDQKFAIVDMFVDLPNVASLVFSEQHAGALVGALAGLYTTTDKIGFIGGQNIDLIRRFAAGYYWGANLTNPTLNIKNATGSPNISTAFVGTDYTAWDNIPQAETLADGMYTTDIDIIFGCAGGSTLGVINSASENNASYPHPLWAIGVDRPYMHLGCADPENPEPPTYVLSSGLKRVDVSVYSFMEDILNDDFTGGLNFYTIHNGGLDWERKDDLLTLPTWIVNTVENVRTGMLNGTYDVPTDFTFLQP